MRCEKCGAEDHETAQHPADPQPDKIDKLIEAMRGLHVAPAPAATPAPTPEPDPLPAGPTQTEIAAKFKELVNAGKADEAYQFVSTQVLTPQMQAMMQPVMASMGEQNVQRLRDQFGAKFTKRESLFRAKQREYNIRSEMLANMKVVQDLWRLTYTDDPTYEKEEADARIADARKQWEDEQARKTPASLGPTPATYTLPAELKDDGEKLLPKEADIREYLESNLQSYGVTLKEYLEQKKKEDNPAATESVGVGPFKKRMFTLIGEPPKDTPRRRRS